MAPPAMDTTISVKGSSVVAGRVVTGVVVDEVVTAIVDDEAGVVLVASVAGGPVVAVEAVVVATALDGEASSSPQEVAIRASTSTSTSGIDHRIGGRLMAVGQISATWQTRTSPPRRDP